MSKSIKLNNNNYWDTSGIVHNKKKLSDILLTGTHDGNWNTSKSIPYINAVKPMLIWIWWSASFVLYTFYNNRLTLITSNKQSYDTISYEIDTTNKKINFTLSNTGLCYYVTMP